MSVTHAIANLLSAPKKVVLTIHQGPDGDALGSGLALQKFLQKEGHQVVLVSPDGYPKFLGWLPGIASLLMYSDVSHHQKIERAIKEADVVFCIDFSEMTRLSDLAETVGKSKAIKVVIDHHLKPEQFADLMISDPSAPATAMLIYRFISAVGKQTLIDYEMATCLYVGILADTGNFQHANTNVEAHEIVARLLSKGVRVGEVSNCMQLCDSLNKVRFMGNLMTRGLVVMKKYKSVYFKIPKADIRRFNLQRGDLVGISSRGLEIEDMLLSVSLREHPSEHGQIRLSFRSRGKVNVNELASKYFSGGGHVNAAGGTSHLSLEATEQRLRMVIEQEMGPWLSKSN